MWGRGGEFAEIVLPTFLLVSLRLLGTVFRDEEMVKSTLDKLYPKNTGSMI